MIEVFACSLSLKMVLQLLEIVQISFSNTSVCCQPSLGFPFSLLAFDFVLLQFWEIFLSSLHFFSHILVCLNTDHYHGKKIVFLPTSDSEQTVLQRNNAHSLKVSHTLSLLTLMFHLHHFPTLLLIQYNIHCLRHHFSLLYHLC